MDFGHRIRSLREKYSIYQIADHIGVSPRTVEGYLQGRSPSPSSARLVKILEKNGIILPGGPQSPPQEA